MRCLSMTDISFSVFRSLLYFLLRSYMLKRKDSFTPSVNFLFLEAAVCKVGE